MDAHWVLKSTATTTRQVGGKRKAHAEPAQRLPFLTRERGAAAVLDGEIGCPRATVDPRAKVAETLHPVPLVHPPLDYPMACTIPIAWVAT